MTTIPTAIDRVPARPDGLEDLSDPEWLLLRLAALMYVPVHKGQIQRILANLHPPRGQDRAAKSTRRSVVAAGRRPAAAEGAERFPSPIKVNQAWQKLQDRELLVPAPALEQSYRRFGGAADGYFNCPEAIGWEVTRAAVAGEDFSAFLAAIHRASPPMSNHGWGPERLASFEIGLRELRLGIFRNDYEQFNHCLTLIGQSFPGQLVQYAPLVRFFLRPFRSAWFGGLHPGIQATVLPRIFDQIALTLVPLEPLLAALEPHRTRPVEDNGDILRHYLVMALILGDRLDEADRVLKQPEPVWAPLCLNAWLAFLRGDQPGALGGFAEALKTIRQKTSKRKTFISHLSGPFYILALLKEGGHQERKQAGEFLDLLFNNSKTEHTPLYYSLRGLLLGQERKVNQALHWLHYGSLTGTEQIAFQEAPDENVLDQLDRVDPLPTLFLILALTTIDLGRARRHLGRMRQLEVLAREHGHLWAAREFQSLADRLEGEDLPPASGPYPTLLAAFPAREDWEQALKALADFVRLGQRAGGRDAAAGQRRLAWFLGPLQRDACTLEPREQKQLARGGWSRGRVVGLQRLYNRSPDLDFLTPQDWQAGAAIRRDPYGYGAERFEWQIEKALTALVGHPLLFQADQPDLPLELVRGAPELLIEEVKGRLQLRLQPEPRPSGIVLRQETPSRLRLVVFEAQHRVIADIVGNSGLRIPQRARDNLLEVLPQLSSLVNLQSTIGGVGTTIPQVEANPGIHLHLVPHGEGLKLEMLVRPFGTEGPCLPPGRGADTLVAEVAGQRLQTTRVLDRERQRMAAVLEQCPSLAGEEPGGSHLEWIFEDPEACLELLLELGGLAPELALVAWPEGQSLRVGAPVDFERLTLHIARQRDWFGVDGTLEVEEGLVLDLQRLLKFVEESPGRFVPLGEGRFLALTRGFRRRLEELRAFTEPGGGQRRIHPLAVPALESLVRDAANVHSDRHWQEQLARMERARSLEPQIPTTLRAHLRDYQVEGFRWLVRLAEWGVGACLADDMGLGKTVQALALLLARAPAGPALVVAPTSVCPNWQEEAKRWAPTLGVRIFGPGDRDQTLESLHPFDLVICSYGLLQSEAERLAGVVWHTLILDEAQAIKNRLTKRSQAAMGLQANFRLATTGTPIENHLGELWNLFRFLNPGFLGSLEKFNQRFAIPIERNQDREARKRLRTLIQPFILRRTKEKVLEELPPRTEITLKVTLSPEEMVLYEALRRNALEKLEEGEVPAEQNQMRILAEITRLRRACCHPSLAAPESTLEGSKLEVFWAMASELLENGHKALVFSQFVDHLTIIRRFLDERKVVYQYLDGATPSRKRQEAIQAFQKGEGDLFLISLKAGGLGLNLTAADYVFHMDPWWNPAVEDQASDRAHRIGQERPVTVYRLVTSATIEEKIVALHQEKRDLADGLLEGSDMAGRMSAEALLRLIREGG
ncbi:MAG: DEAD/DEAH box helicase [Magnetococcales bacterium]|nr:DEAD/DEAH box helicase [Magnetococcales bacterium]